MNSKGEYYVIDIHTLLKGDLNVFMKDFNNMNKKAKEKKNLKECEEFVLCMQVLADLFSRKSKGQIIISPLEFHNCCKFFKKNLEKTKDHFGIW
jgi:hypothetical protein